jgi:Zn-dependent M28 family amino/carboxypeptidase
MKQKRTAFAALVVVAVLAALIVVPLASADAPTDTTELRDAVTEDGVSKHLKKLQQIAKSNHGHRASGSPGYDASAAYVASKLAEAGYDVEVQGFDFQGFWPLGPSTLEQTAPGSATYKEDIDYSLMSQTEPDDVSGPVTAVDLQLGLGNASTSGCEMSDFAGFPAGHIALIQRGDCYFWQKAKNAAVAGAVGAIIFNQGNIDNEDRMGLIGGTLTADYDGGISVFETTYARGEEWANTPGLEMHMIADVFRGQVTTSNVLAETSGGRDDRVVMVGAHLDSVPEAPGINDNGSGVAVILEIALQR